MNEIPELATIANAKPEMEMTVEHILRLPELCPASKNPKSGSTLTLRYRAGERLLELFALDRYIAAYIGHPIVRDMEFFTQTVAQAAANAIATEITATAELDYNRLNQRQKVVVVAKPQLLDM